MGQTFDKLKSAWVTGSEKNITLLAAGTAYYAFLAMIPMMAVAVLGYGLLASPETVARHASAISAALPPSAASLVTEQLKSVIETKSQAKGFGLLFSLALAIFGARSGAMAIIEGMNVAFNAQKSRSLLRANLLAVAITVGAVLGVGAVAGATALMSWLNQIAGSASGFTITAGMGFAGAALLYRLAPNIAAPEWSAIRKGATLFGIGWAAATSAFGFYAANFGSYNATYGSLSAVVVLLTWLYLSALLLLLGAFYTAQHQCIARD